MTSVYNHRSLAPSASVSRSAPDSSSRLNDALDVIRAEHDGLLSEISVIKAQRDEAEAKMAAQVNELNIIRQTLYDLEGNHHKIRGQYEDELGRLRAEISTYKNAPHSSHQAPHSSKDLDGTSAHDAPWQGGRGASSSRTQANGSTRDSRYRDIPASNPGTGPISPSLGPGTGKELPMLRGPPPGSGPHPGAPLAPNERERGPRASDERGPGGRSLPEERVALPAVRTHPLDEQPRERGEGRPTYHSNLDHNLLPGPRSGIERAVPYDRPEYVSSRHERDDRMVVDPPAPLLDRPSESKSTAVVPSNVTSSGPASFPNESMDIDSVPSEFRKEGSDWYALFNPSAPRRTLDVALVHTLIHESVVCCVRFSADGKYLATGCNRTAQIYDVKTGIKTCVLSDESASKTGDLYIRSVCFSPDGKFLATGAEDKQIRIWDISKRKIRNVFDGHQQEIYSLDFSANGNLIVSGSGDKTARIWDMENGTSKVLTINDQESMGSDAGVTSVAISPDGRYVAAGSLDTVVRIWDVATARLVDRLRGHRDSVYSVAFTPDGKGLVSGSLDKTLKFWDVSGLGKGSMIGKDVVPNPSECRMNFMGHKDYVLSVAVSHDGQWIVSGSKDRGVQFWDAKSAVVHCMLQGHKNSVISIDLSPKGSMLATGSGDWQARIWSYNS